MHDEIDLTPLAEAMPKRGSRRPTVDMQPRYLITPDAAVYLGLSPRTLEKHRCYGTGPTFRKLGGRVVYAIEDLESWANAGTRRSTSDCGVGTVHPAKRIVQSEGMRVTRRR